MPSASTLLDFLAHDAETQSIVVYLEGISGARPFMSALRSATIAKPVVILKSGRKPAGNEAAQTHSGAIVGSDDVFDAALRRAGSLRIRDLSDFFTAAATLGAGVAGHLTCHSRIKAPGHPGAFDSVKKTSNFLYAIIPNGRPSDRVFLFPVREEDDA